MTFDYHIELVHFPSNKTHEAVVENTDGTYTIFIESTLSSIEQKEAFKHAINHLCGMDFEKFDVDIIEKKAHRIEASSELCPVI